jgi:GNAT superfamily N-acetyltransferase
VTHDDAAFLLALYASTRAEEIAAWGWDEATARLFVEQQHRAREAAYASADPDADDRILLSPEDEPIGRVRVARGPEEIRLVDVALLPEWRGRGVGSRLLEALIEEAGARHTPLRLSVLRESPARRLYERAGLAPVAGEGPYLEMVWAVSSARD